MGLVDRPFNRKRKEPKGNTTIFHDINQGFTEIKQNTYQVHNELYDLTKTSKNTVFRCVNRDYTTQCRKKHPIF
jgi:hypothetical protein